MNKNYILLALVIAFLSACQPSKIIEFDVTATGLTDGVFTIKNQGQQTIFGENIKNGKCVVKKQLDEPGFYELDVVKDGGSPHSPFTVYLEPGKYSVTVNAGNLAKYPKIESTSKKQQEFTNYYALSDELKKGDTEKKAELNKRYSEKDKLSKEAFVKLLDEMAKADMAEYTKQYAILEQYIKKYPDSELAGYLMARQNYADHPEQYMALYKKLSPAAKASDEGKEVAEKLNSLLQLAPGKKAPQIAGKTFDGKTFAEITAGKKLFLIDFWKSANQYSRTNHDVVVGVYNQLKAQGFQVISVSMDKKPLWWSTAVKDDKLPWPQMCDLKGNDSPNVKNWNLSSIPTYYLVDADWKIYKQDIALNQVLLEASQYLNKHE